MKVFRDKQILTRFRTSVHSLKIETGRYERVRLTTGKYKMLEREGRICQYCNLNQVEDECHLLNSCPRYNIEREVFFKNISILYKNFSTLNEKNKLIWLLNNEDFYVLNKLSIFLQTCFEIRKNHNTKDK